jgi:hypothetical protein
VRLALLLSAALIASAGAARAGGGLADCEKKVPAEADAVFARVAAAFRDERASDVTSQVSPAREARLTLRLAGTKAGSYTREQATQLLTDTYFADRDVLSVRPAEGCTTGDDTVLSRTYRTTLRVGKAEVEGTLTIRLVKRKVDERTSAWFLDGLNDA